MNHGAAALERAIKHHFKTQSALARLVGVTPQNVSDLVRTGRRIPAEWCLTIESATGGEVTRHELRPDLYPIGATGPVEQPC